MSEIATEDCSSVVPYQFQLSSSTTLLKSGEGRIFDEEEQEDEQKGNEEDDDNECPICCYELSDSDQKYCLECTTTSCRFNYCYACILAMQKSIAETIEDDASDGSEKGVFRMHCPFCRGQYQSSKHACDAVVQSVLSLREAHAMQSLLSQNDSDLSATELARKDRFVKMRCAKDLKSSARRLAGYLRENGKGKSIPSLDWELFENHLSGRPADEECATRTWRDPTLFLGLDELMTTDEQSFVTLLFVCGQEDLVAQAALILHGMLHIQREKASAGMTSGHQDTTWSKIKPLIIQALRRRYPLPNHMPRCVSLPVPDMESDNNNITPSLFNFQKDALVLRHVWGGPPGQAGLRRGDVVTHVNGEPVHTQQDVANALLQAHRSQLQTTLFVVNADPVTAKALKERALHMKHDGLKLY